jgi:hypothetical protein
MTCRNRERIGRAGHTRGPGVVTREVTRREMAAGEGTGKVGRPPLTGKKITANNRTLSTRMINSYLAHKH